MYCTVLYCTVLYCTMDRSGRVKEGMEHVEVDPLSLHGACPTLLGIKASQVSAGFIIIWASVIYLHFPLQWISNKWIREGAQVSQYIFYHSVDQLWAHKQIWRHPCPAPPAP